MGIGERKAYDTDLTDEQWALLEPLVPPVKSGGRRAKYERRDIVNGVLYSLRTGCAWRHLPHDLPPWRSVYNYYWTWRRDGTRTQIHDTLRDDLRQALGHGQEPSMGIVDSQSVKTIEKGVRGYDAGKKVNGRKRHLVVDKLGLVLPVLVTAASVQDREGAKTLLASLAHTLKRLHLLFADSAHAGDLEDWLWCDVRQWRKIWLQIVRRPEGQKGFMVQAKRWVVERGFGWLNRWRRLSKDHEGRPKTSECLIHIAMIALMTRCLAALRDQTAPA